MSQCIFSLFVSMSCNNHVSSSLSSWVGTKETETKTAAYVPEMLVEGLFLRLCPHICPVCHQESYGSSLQVLFSKSSSYIFCVFLALLSFVSFVCCFVTLDASLHILTFTSDVPPFDQHGSDPLVDFSLSLWQLLLKWFLVTHSLLLCLSSALNIN